MKNFTAIAILFLSFVISPLASDRENKGHEDIKNINVFIGKGGGGYVNLKVTNQEEINLVHSKAIMQNLVSYGFTDVILDPQDESLSISAKYDDIFKLIRFFDTSTPFSLRNDSTFSVTWNGSILDISFHSNYNEENIPMDNSDMIKIEIATEGEFIKGTTGIISNDNKKLVVNQALRIIIKNLGE